MRKTFIISALALILSACVTNRGPVKPSDELRAVWFSYFDWENLPKDENDFRKEAASVVTNVKETGLNAIFLHVHSHSDSYYLKSKNFPLARRAFGDDRTSNGYDPLQIFIDLAHAQGLQLHAWLNPYRIGSQTEYDSIPADSLIGKWRDSPEYRYILFHKGAYYLNPSKNAVREAFVSEIQELCKNYAIDGVHLDDYFYPPLDDTNPELCFDKDDYESSDEATENVKTITQWRRDNVSSLVEKIHAAVKEEKPGIPFGISPQGNIDNLKSQHQYFVDIEKWLSNDGYVDYILPQLYWGFEGRKSNGEIAPWAFENNLKRWAGICTNKNIKLYTGLALYKAGGDYKEGNEVSEWQRYDDIIARQIKVTRKEKRAGGFVIFDYRDTIKEETKKEMINIRKIL